MPDTQDTIRKMYLEEKLSMDQIASQLGVSRSTIRYRLIQAGIPLHDRQTIDRVQVKKLYEGGLSPNQIAQELDCSRAGAKLVLKELGIPLRSMSESHAHRTEMAFGFTPSKEALQKLMEENDWNAALAADSCGVKYTTLYGYLRKFGIERKGVRVAGEPSSFARARMVLRAEKEDVLLSFENRQCEICGENRVFELAHILANRDEGQMVKENILLLCPTHHALFDQGKLLMQEFLLIKARVRHAEQVFSFQFAFYGEW